MRHRPGWFLLRRPLPGSRHRGAVPRWLALVARGAALEAVRGDRAGACVRRSFGKYGQALLAVMILQRLVGRFPRHCELRSYGATADEHWLWLKGLEPVRPDHPSVLGPFGEADCLAAAARDCLRMVTRYFTPSMVRNAVMTAIRIGAVWSAPTWVRNAASSTIENDAGATAPGTAASRQVKASPRGMPGKTWWTRTPAVPPMNREGKMGPPTNPLPWLTAKLSIFAIRMATSKPNPRVPASVSTVLS